MEYMLASVYRVEERGVWPRVLVRDERVPPVRLDWDTVGSTGQAVLSAFGRDLSRIAFVPAWVDYEAVIDYGKDQRNLFDPMWRVFLPDRREVALLGLTDELEMSERLVPVYFGPSSLGAQLQDVQSNRKSR